MPKKTFCPKIPDPGEVFKIDPDNNPDMQVLAISHCPLLLEGDAKEDLTVQKLRQGYNSQIPSLLDVGETTQAGS